jgi:hypothetical protein
MGAAKNSIHLPCDFMQVFLETTRSAGSKIPLPAATEFCLTDSIFLCMHKRRQK